MSDNLQVVVGQSLAFRGPWGIGWNICKVEKITPTGRIVCGTYVLNPDLTVRGRTGSPGAPFQGYVITEQIKLEVKRQQMLSQIRRTKISELDDRQLEAIVAAIEHRNGNDRSQQVSTTGRL